MIKTTIAAALISLAALAAVPAQASGLSVQVGMGPGWSDNGDGRDGWSDHSGRGWRDHGRRHEMQRYRMSTEEIFSVLRDWGFYRIRLVDEGRSVDHVIAQKEGRTFFLVVSTRNGEVLARQPI